MTIRNTFISHLNSHHFNTSAVKVSPLCLLQSPKNLLQKKKDGFSVIEILVVLVILSLVSLTVHRFTWHYFRSYITIDDKLESITEAWQILRVVNDDLFCSDFPDGNPQSWLNAVKTETDGFKITRRVDDKLISVFYRVDWKKGDIIREDGMKTMALLKNRCKNFQIKVEQRNSAKGGLPEMVWFKVTLEIVNMQNSRDKAQPVSIETNVIPIFLNKRLNHRFVSEGLP